MNVRIWNKKLVRKEVDVGQMDHTLLVYQSIIILIGGLLPLDPKDHGILPTHMYG